MIADLAAVGFLDKIENILQATVHISIVIADHRDANGCGLPFIFSVQLRHGNIVFVPDLVFQALDHHSLVFERLGRRDE